MIENQNGTSTSIMAFRYDVDESTILLTIRRQGVKYQKNEPRPVKSRYQGVRICEIRCAFAKFAAHLFFQIYDSPAKSAENVNLFNGCLKN